MVTSPPTANPVTVGYRGVPAGTQLYVVLDQPLGLHSFIGQRFGARVVQPVVDPSGRPLIPTGAIVTGYVADIRHGGFGQPAVMSLQLEDLRVDGTVVPIAGRVLATDVEAPRHGVQPSYLVGGAAGGAVLGGILGGGKGALAGALVGGGAGTIISLGRDEGRADLPAGTALAIELEQPIPADALATPYYP
jgi:hypothetical protein